MGIGNRRKAKGTKESVLEGIKVGVVKGGFKIILMQ